MMFIWGWLGSGSKVDVSVSFSFVPNGFRVLMLYLFSDVLIFYGFCGVKLVDFICFCVFLRY